MGDAGARGEVRVGCAGWSIPPGEAARFPGEGAHLERYARVLDAAEINSSFHRPHRRSTYERWAASTPDAFRFAAKVPKEVTHKRKLVDSDEPLARFLDEAGGLGEKLAVLLVQLPPSLAFDPTVAAGFFDSLRSRFPGAVVCEPRHPTWFEPDADRLLVEHQVARVAADPAVVPAAAEPGGGPGIAYFRLHGAPRVYYSSYEDGFLDALAARIERRADAAPVWCVFDNTASGAAVPNALGLADRIRRG